MATPRRKACVECRQQKIRCDVEQHKIPHEPCTRCKKMGLDCRILPTSTRNLRQTKAEMRRELEELRWNMRHSNDPNHTLSNPPSSVDLHNYSPLEGPRSCSNTVASASPPYDDLGSIPSTRQGSQLGHTCAKALDGYMVDAKKIDDCFHLCFTQYHEHLPILDPSLTPEDYYHLSPFLFWCIVVTGSRRYAEDPMILEKISPLIPPLAFSHMALRTTPIPVIQGLLILCTWRLPTNSMYKDMTHVLCGAAVHLATQIGLHVAGVGQDFARMPLKKDLDQKMFRAKLWMNCVLVSIRTSCAEGIPPLVIAETFFDSDGRDLEDMLTYLPPNLLFLHRVHIILLRALSALVRTDLKPQNYDATLVRSLISIFDSKLVSLAPSSPSEIDTFQLNCARIHILAFHFYACPPDLDADMESLCRLYALCVSTLNTANTLSHTTNFATICPSFIDRTMTLVGFCILKLVRSPVAQHLDLPAGEQAYSYAIQFSKSQSLQNNDLGARAAAIMTQLWSSTRVFKRRDGQIDSLSLRLRTRLSMSVSFDMFWYWREEFGNMSNPYNADESQISSNAVSQPITPQYEKQQILDAAPALPVPAAKYPVDPSDQLQNPVGMNFDTWDGTDYTVPPALDQFPDYDWAASFDFSNDWPSGPLGQLPENTGYNFGQVQ